MPFGGDEKIGDLLRGLESDDAAPQWEQFIDAYGAVVFQVVRLFEKDADSVHDCFMFICEQLLDQQGRRLRNYEPSSGATFSTWLRCVVRNLCIDWTRAQKGRARPFKAIQKLTQQEQEVFRLHFLAGHSLSEVWGILRTQDPAITEDLILEIAGRLHSILSPRQRWLIQSRYPALESLSSPEPSSERVRELLGKDSSPEEQLLRRDELRRLRHSLQGLTSSERLLIRLRFEEGLSLQRCAEILGLENPQKVHRGLSAILLRLRKLLTTPSGKPDAASVEKK